MWYRISIDLSNLRPMNPVESGEIESSPQKNLTEQPIHKAVEKFHFHKKRRVVIPSFLTCLFNLSF